MESFLFNNFFNFYLRLGSMDSDYIKVNYILYRIFYPSQLQNSFW